MKDCWELTATLNKLQSDWREGDHMMLYCNISVTSLKIKDKVTVYVEHTVAQTIFEQKRYDIYWSLLETKVMTQSNHRMWYEYEFDHMMWSISEKVMQAITNTCRSSSLKKWTVTEKDMIDIPVKYTQTTRVRQMLYGSTVSAQRCDTKIYQDNDLDIICTVTSECWSTYTTWMIEAITRCDLLCI